MARFVINQGYGDEKTVTAENFHEKESFVIFSNNGGHERVYAFPTKAVRSIELIVE